MRLLQSLSSLFFFSLFLAISGAGEVFREGMYFEEFPPEPGETALEIPLGLTLSLPESLAEGERANSGARASG